jgi:succinate dehydrogenase / fumarate reductase cytochrome b subunit
MSENHSPLWSSIGRKFITGITGLLLVGFLVVHLIGNTLLLVGADAFNHYAHFLETAMHGGLMIGAEIGLLAVIGFHIVAAFKVQLSKRRARTTQYAETAFAGGNSKKSISSLNMIITGSVLLIFLVLHIIHFKYGPKEMIHVHDGTEIKDLYGLVVHEFKNPLMVVLYMAVMVMLGSHLKHGIWSAFQSIGATRKSTLPVITAVGIAVAIILAIGFLLIPLLVMFLVPDPTIDPQTAATIVTGGAR